MWGAIIGGAMGLMGANKQAKAMDNANAANMASFNMYRPYVESNLGAAEVRQIFKFSKIGKIAGSYVKNGVVRRNALARIYRNNEIVFEGKLSSLKRFEEDVKEVATGYECGIVIDGFSDLKENDSIQCYEMVLKKP